MFYLIGVVINAKNMADYYSNGVRILIAGQPQNMPLTGLSIIVIIMNVVLALRLYLHAWIIDESKDFINNIKKKKRNKRIGEWICRLLWIAGISWLPSAYTEFPKQLGPIKVHVHYFIFGIMLFLFIWDCLTKSIITSYSKENKKDLAKNWITLDLIMLVIIFISSLAIEIVPNSGAYNWLSIASPLGYFAICVICLVQLGIWGRKILFVAKMDEAEAQKA